MNYLDKYIKYKNKYLKLKNNTMHGGFYNDEFLDDTNNIYCKITAANTKKTQPIVSYKKQIINILNALEAKLNLDKQKTTTDYTIKYRLERLERIEEIEAKCVKAKDFDTPNLLLK